MEVQSTRAVIRSQEPLTVGLRGAKAQFTFGRDWDGLIKTAVFRQGNETVAVTDVGQEVTIPWEVLTEPGVPVEIGVYGIDSTGNIAIPTLWAVTHPVRPGVDPEADPSAEPTPGLWEQMQGQLGSLEDLDTNDKSSLVAAVNEANRAAYVVTLEDKNGLYFSKQPVSDILAAHQEGKVILCDWRGSLIPLRCVMGSDLFFGGAIGITVYHIQVRSNKQTYITTYSLAEKDDIPEKVSDLENDSGYLTEAPVTSVNGQTGDVTVPEIFMVTVNSSNMMVDKPFSDILTAYSAGYDLLCNYEGFLLPLKIEPNDSECVFSGTVGTTVYSVVVQPTMKAMVHKVFLAQQNDIPKNISQLENDKGYLTEAPVTSVNGQTGDVTVSETFLVTVTQDEGGTYTADQTYTDLLLGEQEGKTLVCFYSNENVYLPLTARKGPFTFSAIVNSYLYQIGIYLSGGDRSANVIFSKTELSALSNGAGITAAQIADLDELFRLAAYTQDASGKYASFRSAFGLDGAGGDSGDSGDTGGGDNDGETEATLASISVNYSGGEVAVGTAVTELTGVVVTATYSDDSTATVTDYTLSGIIAEGSNTITVSYGGMTATFVVTGIIESNVPSDVVIPEGYELVKVLEEDDIVYGVGNAGLAPNITQFTTYNRAAYPYLQISVHRGYKYRVDVEYNTTDTMWWGIAIHPPVGAQGNNASFVYDSGWIQDGSLTWETDIVETNTNIKDITNIAWLCPGFRREDNADIPEGAIKRVVISRKLIEGAITGGDEWETVRTITADEIVYGLTPYGAENVCRASYPYLNIPVEVGYYYHIETETTADSEMNHGFNLLPAEGVSNYTEYLFDDGWKDAEAPQVVEVTANNSQITDIDRVAWGCMSYKMKDNSTMEQGTVQKTTITRRKVSE